ncbi:MAG: diaminopimelate epimerase [Candidatus Omnitrophota bacterium]|nr:diaminopimelate epimerase [Candidatus Omnitrophota bacterium]
MKKIKFTKMVGSGNDFIVIQGKPFGNLSVLAKTLCNRRFGIGADGLLILEKSKKADIRMRIFNADGSEAQMCGNGARCAAYVIASSQRRRGNLKKRDCFAPAGLAMTIETKAGVINGQVHGKRVKVRITGPKGIKLDMPIKVNGRSIKVNFINTGVPHTVVFVNGINAIDVRQIGASIRNHAKFRPAGTNVNFVEVKEPNTISIRTYERGVEDETLACGTGSAAAALIFALKNNLDNLIKVKTESGEILKVYFQKEDGEFRKVWLEGSARIVYKGEYYV